VIVRESLRSCIEERYSYNLTYMFLVLKTASYLSGHMLAPALVHSQRGIKTGSIITPELRRFAYENREIIEKALAPYSGEVDAAPLEVVSEEEFEREIKSREL
jgi:hypothetical protein